MIQLAGPNPKFSMDPGHAPNTDFARQEPHDFKPIGSAFRVLQLNVEDLSTAKRQIIVTIAQHHKVDIVCLQETHVADLTAGRYDIDGYDLPSAAPDVKYGRTTYTRSSISDATTIASDQFYDVVQVGDFTISKRIQTSECRLDDEPHSFNIRRYMWKILRVITWNGAMGIWTINQYLFI